MMKKYILDNLDCPVCATKIEESIKNLSCVESAKVVFATKTLMIDTSDIDKVQSKINEIEDGVIISEPTYNHTDKDDNFNVKKELTILGFLLILFGVGFYLLNNFESQILYYVGFIILVAT